MKSLTIGGLLLDAGKITPADAERILRTQKEQGLRFGDAGKALGLISEEDIQQALSQQFGSTFISTAEGYFSSELIAAYQPFSEQVEILRAIRNQLMLRWFNNGNKALAITSPGTGEGRSYLAANLAIVFSQLGERVLLIDANLRQPRQHQLFKIEEKRGLSDLLANRADASIITKVPVFLDLSILAAGTIPPNPPELISRSLAVRLEQFAQDYDVILLDTSAALQGSEAQLVAEKANGALLLARLHQTRLADIETIKNQFENSGVNCVGTVISDF